MVCLYLPSYFSFIYLIIIDQIFCGMLDDLQPLLPLKQEIARRFTQEEIDALGEQIEALGGMEMIHNGMSLTVGYHFLLFA